MSIVPVLSLGFVLGMTHATDPDHVVALSTMMGRPAIVRAPRSAARVALTSAATVGTFWGLGHTVTVLVLGGTILAFRLSLPPSVGLALELGVALMLVALGLAGVRLRATPAVSRAQRGRLRSLAIGAVHGLAGSAAVALGVLSQTSDAALGLGYLLCFGVGTVAGMMLVTSALALPFMMTSRCERFMGWLRSAAGVASVTLGVVLFIKIGFVDGLFTTHPRWSPH